MEIEASHPFKYLPFLIWGLVLFFLYLTSHYSFLFHSLAEIFSVVIAIGVFAVAWSIGSHGV
jgi:hypothetical protein